MLRTGEAYPEVLKTVIIQNANWARQAFSNDHKLYALLVQKANRFYCPKSQDYRNSHLLYIVELSEKNGKPDPNSLIQKLSRKRSSTQIADQKAQTRKTVTQSEDLQNYICYLDDKKLTSDLSFAHKLIFDNNKRFLLIVGHTKVYIYDIIKQKGSFYDIPEQILEKILDVRFYTVLDKENDKFSSIKCMVACKRTGFNQIYTFDLFERIIDDQYQENLLMAQLRREPKLQIRPKQKMFSYLHDASQNQRVCFSVDGKSVLYCDDNEKFIVQSLTKDTQIKRNLNQLENKVVYFILPDPDPTGEGFYVLSSFEYDNYLRIQHSHRADLDETLKISMLIEPGLLKTFEVHIKVLQKNRVSNFESKQHISQTKNVIQIIQQVDQHFSIDQVSYIQYRQVISDSNTKKGAQDQLLTQNLLQMQIIEQTDGRKLQASNQDRAGNMIYHQQDLEFKKSQKSDVTAFSFNWPYMAFGATHDYLMIINAFEQDTIHRVQLFEDNQDIDICSTYIADTYDLFCLVYQNKEYHLFMLDLDMTNTKNVDIDTNSLNYSYVIGEPILKYSEDCVSKQIFRNIHIRGSSRKDVNDIGNKCVCLFQFGQSIYIWIQNDDRVQGTTVTLALTQPMSSFTWQIGCQSSIYFMQDEDLMHQQLNTLDHQNQIFERQNIKKNQKNQENSDDYTNFTQEIKRLEIKYSTIKICSVYQEMSLSDKIIDFSFDKMAGKILMILKADNNSQKVDNILYTFKLFDLKYERVQFQMNIRNKIFIGRMLSGFYTVINGHMYFKNDVIKIRYDLIEQQSSYKYNENSLFDSYMDIFQLKDGIDILTSKPIDCFRSHRMAYIKQDKYQRKCYKILFLPYLNECRLYLDPMSTNANDHFYTSMQVKQEDINAHTLELVRLCNVKEQQFEEQLLGRRNTLDRNTFNSRPTNFFEQITTQGGQPDDFIKLKLLNDYYQGQKIEQQCFMAIFSLNLTQNKCSIFNENGIVINRINYTDQVKKYGQIIAVSPDGCNFVFKKSDEELQVDRFIKNKSPNSTRREHFTFNVFSLTLFGMCFIKSVNLIDCIEDYHATPTADDGSTGRNSFNFNKNYGWLLQKNLDQLLSTCFLTVKINNNADICIQAKSIPSSRSIGKSSCENQFVTQDTLPEYINFESNILEHDIWIAADESRGQGRLCESKLLYYFEQVAHKLDLKKVKEKNGTRITDSLLDSLNKKIQQLKTQDNPLSNHVIQTEGMFGETYELNDDSLFLIEYNQIHSLNIRDKIYNSECQYDFRKINLDVDTSNKSKNYIKRIQTSQNQQQIAIVIANLENQDRNTVLIWDLEQNAEISIFEVEQQFKIISDHTGCLFIVQNNHLIDTQEQCKIKAYGFQNHEQLDKNNSRYINLIDRGIRFDGFNHNWLVLSEFLALPYSYMTFVIQDQIQKMGHKNFRTQFQFDAVPYNYLMNKQSVFHDSNFITDDFEHLRYVVCLLMKYDPELIEMLHIPIYSSDNSKNQIKDQNTKRRESVLSLAISQEQIKNVSLLLKYMAKSPIFDFSSRNHLFTRLIDYESFKDYMDQMMFQTNILSKKHKLKVSSNFSEKIVAIHLSQTAYVDENFFQNYMSAADSDQDDAKFIPVKIQVLPVSWIFNKEQEKHALKFFDKILDNSLLNNMGIQVNNSKLQFFKIEGLQILIDYLYIEIRQKAIIQLPPFLVFSTALVYYIYLNLNYRDVILFKLHEHEGRTHEVIEQQKQDHDSPIHIWFRTYNYIWLVICMFYFLFIISRIKIRGCKNYLLDPAGVADILLCILGLVVFALVLNLRNFEESQNEQTKIQDTGIIPNLSLDQYQDVIKTQRIVFVIMSQLFVFKLFKYMKDISEKFDILFEVIITVMFDIIYLVIILFIWSAVSALSFFLIGQNQLDFDQVTAEDKENVEYGTVIGSFYYIYKMLLGEAGSDGFQVGKSSQFIVLTILYWITSFIIMIHLLNMLIAVMGNTFNQRAEIAVELNYQNHLRFIRQNWHYIDIFFKELRNTKYLIVASPEEIKVADEEQIFEDQLWSTLENQDNQMRVLLKGQSQLMARTKKILQTGQNQLDMQLKQYNQEYTYEINSQ